MRLSPLSIPFSQEQSPNDNEYIIDDEYIMHSKQKLGNGHFGHTFKGISIKTKLEYAIKIEQNTTLVPQLEKEYTLLRELRGQPGIPNAYYFKDHGQDKAMVIDLLGPNLEEVMKNTKKKAFSMKSVLMIADQLLNITHCLHEKEVIHRDLKPENIVIGLEKHKQGSLFLIDFGLSCKFLNPKTNEHIPYRDKKPFGGTALFASEYTHLGIEQSRRDDLESLGYTLVYFALGELPWQRVKSKTQEEKLQKIMEMKCECKDKGELTKNLPEEIKLYFDNVAKLGFTEKPNYHLLRGLISSAMNKLGLYIDNRFDWCCEELNENPVSLLRELREKEKEENQRKLIKDSIENKEPHSKKMTTQNTMKAVSLNQRSSRSFLSSRKRGDNKKSHSFKTPGSTSSKMISEPPPYNPFLKRAANK